MERSKPAIRPIVDCEKPAAAALWLRASSIAHPFFTNEQLVEQQQLVRDVYLEKAETLVAEKDGKVIGFIGLLDTWIGGLFVDPNYQGHGVGRALIDHAAAEKQQLALEAYESNEAAIGFYRRLGFDAVGRREIDDNDLPFPLIKMTRAG